MGGLSFLRNPVSGFRSGISDDIWVFGGSIAHAMEQFP
jgi:hypothetical protein